MMLISIKLLLTTVGHWYRWNFFMNDLCEQQQLQWNGTFTHGNSKEIQEDLIWLQLYAHCNKGIWRSCV